MNVKERLVKKSRFVNNKKRAQNMRNDNNAKVFFQEAEYRVFRSGYSKDSSVLKVVNRRLCRV